MSSSELHEALFKWPHSEPRDVIVTGSFDSWSQTIHLSRTPTGFAGTVKIPWGQKVSYKYIVDGLWTTTDTQPTELDPIGNINNVYNAPARPIQPKTEAPLAVLAPPAVALTPIEPKSESTASQANGAAAIAKKTVVVAAEAIAPEASEESEPAETQASLLEPTIIESAAAAVKNAATAATETTALAASAAVTAVTAAIQAVSGAETKDEPVASESPKALEADPETEAATAPEPDPAEPKAGQELAPESVLPPSADSNPIAPDVPVFILPLNANSDVPTTNGDSGFKVPNAAVVEGAVTSEGAPAVPAKDASTLAPVIVNGEATTSEPTAVILPPVTPSEVLTTPAAPATNGNSKVADASAPVPTPASDAPPSPGPVLTNGHSKRMNFPTLGRNHRHSSSVGSQSEQSETSSANNTVASRMNSQRKGRKSSIFGKIKEFFHHDHHLKEKSAN